ncbi:hypothetical protein C0Q44_08590 [Paenibacillus sp. PCH8]|uniref:LicD family protein n=1 Tax=Paenibacillus sp. PCH8 TaxID=2066524 RepID=UPI000CFA0E29|nr:LicD family protein [Paenibacillus sp. PCH8]PQP84598.1 hypothetical protein C0Q44_08590 [Paenibacillus sp. PCH8]
MKEVVVRDYMASEEVKKLWAVEMDLIDRLKEVCDRHNLTYYMSGGTLLGAVRHQGFIPWDDDADFLMPRKDYEKLKLVAAKEFTEPYFLQTEESDPGLYLGGFARLRNSHTTNITYAHMSCKANFGIWIDISILDFLAEDKSKRKIQVNRIRFFQRLMYAKTFKRKEGLLELSDFHWFLFKLGTKMCSRSWISKQLKAASSSCEYSKFVTSFAYHADQYFPIELETVDFKDVTPMNFQTMLLPAPVGFKNYLYLKYGREYMDLPPEEERKPAHIGVLSIEIPYTKFIMNSDNLKDVTDSKNVVIFGAGQMLQYYLERTENKRPKYILDNDPMKWGMSIQDIDVKSPQYLLDENDKETIVLICSIHYRSIVEQLKNMKISEYAIFVQNQYWL